MVTISAKLPYYLFPSSTYGPFLLKLLTNLNTYIKVKSVIQRLVFFQNYQDLFNVSDFVYIGIGKFHIKL